MTGVPYLCFVQTVQTWLAPWFRLVAPVTEPRLMILQTRTGQVIPNRRVQLEFPTPSLRQVLTLPPVEILLPSFAWIGLGRSGAFSPPLAPSSALPVPSAEQTAMPFQPGAGLCTGAIQNSS